MKLIFSERNRYAIDTIVTSIKSEDAVKNKERLNNLLKMFSYEFLTMEYFKGKELLEFAKENNVPINFRDNFLLFEHEQGSALINTYFSNDIELSPAIFLQSNDFINRGGTFSTGHFSDVDFVLSNHASFFFIVTTDTIPLHNIYLVWITKKIEESFYDDDFEIKEVEYDFFLSDYHRELFNSLHDEIIEATLKNKGKRIDRIKINEIIEGEEIEMYIDDYINKYKIYKHFCSSNDLFRMCIKFGKPYTNMKRYVKLHGL